MLLVLVLPLLDLQKQLHLPHLILNILLLLAVVLVVQAVVVAYTTVAVVEVLAVTDHRSAVNPTVVGKDLTHL
jgi:hypothetical protein